MRPLSLSPLLASTEIPSAGSKANSPERIKDAAQQFESLLLSQFLRSARGEGSGWLGGDATSESLTDMAEQQFATVLSQSGGLGIAGLISRGMAPKP
jgi:Rod binding domain-containing protein